MSRVLFLFCRVFFYVFLIIVKWLTQYISGFAADFSSVYENMISVEVERARTILGAPGPWAVGRGCRLVRRLLVLAVCAVL